VVQELSILVVNAISFKPECAALARNVDLSLQHIRSNLPNDTYHSFELEEYVQQLQLIQQYVKQASQIGYMGRTFRAAFVPPLFNPKGGSTRGSLPCSRSI
jgi:hypothetical protein